MPDPRVALPGSGGVVPTPQHRICPDCHGAGQTPDQHDYTPAPWNETDHECGTCNGQGAVTWEELRLAYALAGVLGLAARVVWDRAVILVDDTEAKAA